jgi:uncharacterized protein with GYD domain
MASFLYQVAYTPEAWAAMAKNPQDRLAAITPAVQALGGKIVAGYWAFGEYDLIVIVDGLSNGDAAAFAIAAAAGGACKALRTTPLLTMAEGVEAARKAGASSYKPPAS